MGDNGNTIKRTRPPKGWRRAFLKALGSLGNVRAACAAAKVSRKTAYQHRERDERFAFAWTVATQDAVDVLEAEAWRRAVRGTERPVFHKGEKCGTVREYSDTLLIFLLKANSPIKFRDLDEKKLAVLIAEKLREAGPLDSASGNDTRSTTGATRGV